MWGGGEEGAFQGASPLGHDFVPEEGAEGLDGEAGVEEESVGEGGEGRGWKREMGQEGKNEGAPFMPSMRHRIALIQLMCAHVAGRGGRD